ncbi:MAG: hypothetical protein E5X76_17835 [Mesorhizobium sp.]|nr:MAG: hypothetical protein E5X76_17835 [Mesorhizobium sp.]
MSDPFENFARVPENTIEHAVAVTPNNTADLATVPVLLWLGGAGDLRVTMLGGETVTFVGLYAGWHPMRVTRVHATGTTATNIVGVW